MHRPHLALLIVLALPACGAFDLLGPGGLAVSNTPDASTPADASTDTPDAGPVDAGTEDAGAEDAGTEDAGAEDAGVEDAGLDADAGPADAGAPDAGAHCVESACALGCCADRCCVLRPSNAADFGSLTGTGDLVVPAGTHFFDTDACPASSAIFGACSATDDVANTCVCRSASLDVAGDVRVEGSRKLAILVAGAVTVRGTIDAGGQLTMPGPGSVGKYSLVASANTGGVGGTFGGFGGGSTMNPYGEADLDPLVAGFAGQDGCASRGGGGGGAIQLSAGIQLTISGAINAGGGGGGYGSDGSQCLGGAGGGSGGAILVEAPEIRLTGHLAANGGGGGSGANDWEDTGGFGEDGNTAAAAAGGRGPERLEVCQVATSTLTGGDGGKGSFKSSNGAAGGRGDVVSCTLPLSGSYRVGYGGGGGGAGRIRLNARTAASCACPADASSPPATSGSVQVE